MEPISLILIWGGGGGGSFLRLKFQINIFFVQGNFSDMLFFLKRRDNHFDGKDGTTAIYLLELIYDLKVRGQAGRQRGTTQLGKNENKLLKRTS